MGLHPSYMTESGVLYKLPAYKACSLPPLGGSIELCFVVGFNPRCVGFEQLLLNILRKNFIKKPILPNKWCKYTTNILHYHINTQWLCLVVVVTPQLKIDWTCL